MDIVEIDLPHPYGHSPLRRQQSFRRTSSVDVHWPEQQRYGPMILTGVARDIITSEPSQPPEVLALDELQLQVGEDGIVASISSTPPLACVKSLRGYPCIGGFRNAYLSLVGSGIRPEAPLVQLLDDVIGSVVVSDWAWSTRPALITPGEKAERRERLKTLSGVCIGFREGSSALLADGNFQYERSAIVPVLPHPDDSQGWHDLKDPGGVSLRRSRCMDVWLGDNHIYLEAVFQDSAKQPDGQRIAVHEYSLHAVVDRHDLTLLKLDIRPHILPYRECPSAMITAQELVGLPLPDFKQRVLTMFRRDRGCTHLNDALRALSDLQAAIVTLAVRFNR